MLNEREKRFAVRLLVERTWPVRWSDRWARSRNSIQVLDFGRHVVIALRTKEESVARATYAPYRTQVGVEVRVRFASTETKIARATFRIEAQRDRDGFEQRRFPRAVLANEERDGLRKCQALQVHNRRQREGIPSEIRYLSSAQADFTKVGFGFGQPYCHRCVWSAQRVS